MRGRNIIVEKSFDLGISIIKIYKQIRERHKDLVLSTQLLKAGTSIGANVREAQNAESKADFIHKLGIAQKEAGETLYLLDLLFQTGYVDKSAYDTIKSEAESVLKIIRSIILSTKQKIT